MKAVSNIPTSSGTLSSSSAIPSSSNVSSSSSSSSSSSIVASTTLNHPLSRGDKQINGSSFAYLFSELIAYYQQRITTASDLENRLHGIGMNIGQRYFELVSYREKLGKRETTMVGILQFLSGTVWMQLFGKTADALEKSTEQAHAYMIRENEPLTGYFISLPKELARLNVSSFIAGILQGMLISASFPCTVQAITVQTDGPRDQSVFLIKFDAMVGMRESNIKGMVLEGYSHAWKKSYRATIGILCVLLITIVSIVCVTISYYGLHGPGDAWSVYTFTTTSVSMGNNLPSNKRRGLLLSSSSSISSGHQPIIILRMDTFNVCLTQLNIPSVADLPSDMKKYIPSSVTSEDLRTLPSGIQNLVRTYAPSLRALTFRKNIRSNIRPILRSMKDKPDFYDSPDILCFTTEEFMQQTSLPFLRGTGSKRSFILMEKGFKILRIVLVTVIVTLTISLVYLFGYVGSFSESSSLPLFSFNTISSKYIFYRQLSLILYGVIIISCSLLLLMVSIVWSTVPSLILPLIDKERYTAYHRIGNSYIYLVCGLLLCTSCTVTSIVSLYVLHRTNRSESSSSFLSSSTIIISSHDTDPIKN